MGNFCRESALFRALLGVKRASPSADDHGAKTGRQGGFAMTMWQRFSTLALVGLLGSLATVAVAKDEVPQLVAEVSPLRLMVGQPAGRIAWRWLPRVSFELAAESWRAPGERADFTDHGLAATIGATYTAWQSGALGVFGGLGVEREEATLGGERERSLLTWARDSDGQNHDVWTVQETRHSLTQAVGVRACLGAFTTAALRLERAETFDVRQSFIREDVVGDDRLPAPKKRAAVDARVTLTAGVWLP
jgi:hypothetical protein